MVLLNKNTNDLNPKIQIKHGEEIVEEITFNEAGTEAYSTLQQDKNVPDRALKETSRPYLV